MTSRDGKSQREEKSRREMRQVREEKKSEERSSDARKGRKVAKHCVFPMICGSRGSKSRLARWEMKKCTPLWREAHFEVKMYKTHHSRTTFGSWDVEKVHAVVARSTFPSQNVQSTPFSDHFWKLRCRKKCALLWREAHFEVKMLKTLGVRTTFRKVEMSKKCTPLWREAHFEVKSVKNWGFWAFFDVKMSKK